MNLDIYALFLGYTVLLAIAAFILFQLWVAVHYPFVALVAEMRVIARENGWRAINWLRVPGWYWRTLRQSYGSVFSYGKGTTTWHGLAVWHAPRHPFSMGRIQWIDDRGNRERAEAIAADKPHPDDDLYEDEEDTSESLVGNPASRLPSREG